MKAAMANYGVTDTANGLYTIEEDPELKQIMIVLRDIKIRLKNNPDRNFLIIYIMAGHGMQCVGKQVLLLNQFDRSSGFYKKWGAEGDIRSIAQMFPNSYQLAFFACCREVWIKTVHSGGVSGTKKEAEEYYLKLQ